MQASRFTCSRRMQRGLNHGLLVCAFIKDYLSLGRSPAAVGRGMTRGEKMETLNIDPSFKWL